MGISLYDAFWADCKLFWPVATAILHLHRQHNAAVYYGLFEHEGRGMIALLGLGSILLAVANRLGLFPTQVARRTQELLYIGNRVMA